jgi:peroxiredoxin
MDVRQLAAAAAVLPLLLGAARAQPPAANPTTPDAATALEGKAAPGFTLPDQNDKARSLAENQGKWVVLAFYPADMTKGCTLQNQSYSANISKFAPLNAAVYTVSTQDTASKRTFCTEAGLKHTLLSDVGGKTAAAYGVLTDRGVARRVTFYIDPTGKIASVDTKPNVTASAEDSLATLARLKEARRPLGGGNPVRAEKTPGRFAGPASTKVTMDALVPDFGLPDVKTGKTVALTSASAGKAATVILFIGTQCPVSNAYNERMARLAAEYGAKNVAFLGINSNATEPTEEVAAHADAKALNFPVLKDAGNTIADRFGARVTPEVYVLDKNNVLVYHGAIDDAQREARVQKRYLASTLDAVLAGQPVPARTSVAVGCTIKRAK